MESMGIPERAYPYEIPDYQQEQRFHAPSINLITTQGRSTKTVTGTSLILMARVIACVFIALALIGMVRLSIASAAVSEMKVQKNLTSQINKARYDMSLLEVEYSQLSSDIDQKAHDMGMNKASHVEKVNLPRDIVALDSNGRLSLSGSIARLTQQAAHAGALEGAASASTQQGVQASAKHAAGSNNSASHSASVSVSNRSAQRS